MVAQLSSRAYDFRSLYQNRSASNFSPNCQTLKFLKNLQDLAAPGEGQLVNRETTNLRKRLSIHMFGVCYHCGLTGIPRPRHGTCFSLTQQVDSGPPSKTNSPTSIYGAGGYNEDPGSTATASLVWTGVGRLSATQGNRTCMLRGFADSYSDGKEKGFSPIYVELSERGVRKDG